MTKATGAVTSNDSDGGFHDSGDSNGNSSKRQQLVTAMGKSNGQQAIAATMTAKVAEEVKAAKGVNTAKASMEQGN